MTISNQQKQQIRDLIRLRTNAFISILGDMAYPIIEDEVRRSEKLARKPSSFRNAKQRTPEEITKDIYNKYLENLNNGGTQCVERIVRQNPDGTYTCTTAQMFVPWLDDFNNDVANSIIDLFGQSETAGRYPLDVAKGLKGIFENTRHRAVTAARTEAQKIRSDARFQTFTDQGVKYVEYIAVDDDRTRPEHQARNGKIYPIDRAPYLGEYNCRCTVSPADYKVRTQNAKVEDSDAIILTADQINGESPVPVNVPTPQTEEERQIAELWQPFTEEEISKMDLTDLQDNITTRWGCEDIEIKENMKDINIDVLRAEILSADKLVRDMGETGLLSVFTAEPTGDSDPKKYYMACQWQPGGSKIFFSKYNLKSEGATELSYNLDVADGFHPKTTNYKDVLTHELGHAVINRLTLRGIKEKGVYKTGEQMSTEILQGAVKQYRAESSKELKDQIKGLTPVEVAGKLISVYASDNGKEAIAEACADYYNSGGNQPNRLSVLIVEGMKRRLKE